jgi:hypothetical protein
MLVFPLFGLTLLLAPLLQDVRASGDELVRDSHLAFMAEHADGTKERVVVKYEAFLQHRVWQEGSVAKASVSKIKLTDDRRCLATTNARVYRRAYIVSHSGVQAPIEGYQAIYSANTNESRGPDNFFQSIAYHRTCEDERNFEDKIAAQRQNLMHAFPDLVAKDDDKARTELARALGAKRLIPLPS